LMGAVVLRLAARFNRQLIAVGKCSLCKVILPGVFLPLILGAGTLVFVTLITFS
jgi:hypothetical protein